ncbi:DUF805 domain-containing protein [Sphingomonas yunnanensis]|uniref:DUF805 domain-containing protein n=1 Tax=Sphingomonas yunnanensis TaxID=310400 RepID=UPI001CA7AD07|nr:DUF805 domain-containing protein [Sphingomonas yunnanensis]MBY9062847.1 DUF805 domain-containing protein [Sphingomonas yunnanensis]
MLPDYVTRPFRLYAVFRGRSTRREYWSFAIVALAVLFAAVCLGGALDGPGSKSGTVTSFVLVGLALLSPGVALKSRRLHDIGLSAWWMLATCVPLVGGVIDLFFGLTPGDAGENRFGPDPRASEPAADPPAEVATG